MARVIKHPGAGLTLSDLQTLKANVDQGKEPWTSAFNQLANSPTSRLSYAGRGGPFAKVSRAPDENLHAWRSDMVAISDLSRMWYFTQNEQYAVNARKLLLGWATTHVEFSGRESMLDLGDYAFAFVGGAEILRSTYPGWTEADTATVKKYFKNVLMPAANPYGESSFGAANKGTLALVALGLMAIYNDDIETLDKVVYQARTLAHIGLRNSNDIGMLGDYLRDQGHAYGQLASLTMLAEALWTQGIDIYSDFDNRLLAAGEYFARVNELVPTTALPFGTTDRYYTSDVTNRGWDGANGGSVALTQLYNAYVLRKGLQAPFIAQRRLWTPVDGTSFMFLKESDTSKATPPPALPIPSTTSITSGFSSADIGGAAPASTATYANGKWTVQGAGNDIFWSTQDACHFTYKAITGNSAIIAKVESVENTHPAAVAGVMMRTSLEQGAPRAWMAVASNGQAKQNMQKLAVYGGSNYGTKAFNIASSTASYWVKLERIGNIITGYVSPDGTNWAATDVGRIDAPVPDTIYVGLVVTSVANGVLNSSTFSNVQITGGNGGAPSVIPEPPAMLLASPGDGAVPLRWQASFGATGYTVQRSKFSGGPSETIASGVTGSSYTDKSVINGTTYYYTVTATNSAGTSGSSPADSATPFHPMVNVATDGIATDSGNTSGAMRAFDQNTGSGWFYKGTTGWLRYDLGRTERVQRYTIRSASGLVPRDPKDWQFQGSNDGSTWTTLDTQSDQAFAQRFELKTYAIANPASYRYYRLNITANNGDSTFTDLSELGLLASRP
ncbi:discoidin domain-containing protein [Variovorax sp. RT4R15]|uniref:discoidin domain-containing protein n=1 Tax=Variovorax sp. RT4R15 TaxID=3443737 RepID=UPI003F4594DA